MPESKFCRVNPKHLNGKPDGFQGKSGLKKDGGGPEAPLREPG
jgi:hypothetical protein